MKLLHLKNTPIFEQLQIEEALLRLDDQNYCIINEGSPPAIVMGISGQLEELVNMERHGQNPIPIIKRFSGGGTVVVNHETLFVSFLFQKEAHDFAPYPEPIMRWTEGLYKEAFAIEGFALRENDYVIGEKKVGGNAQYLRKNRWLHHTTFLWDYQPELMDLLLHPKKTPTYREGRSHEAFITKLSEHLESKEAFLKGVKKALSHHFSYEEISLESIIPFTQREHRKNTQYLVDYTLASSVLSRVRSP